MSLINDALRRANQQKEQPPGASDGAPMQPVHPPQRAEVSFFGPMLLIFFLGVVLTCAVWFFWKSWSAKSADVPVTISIENSTVVSPKPVSTSQSTPPIAQAKVEPPVATIAESNSIQTDSTLNAAAPVETAALPVTPSPPALKLKGIFYRITNPTALINGKTVAVGEKVEGARVVKIAREEVTLERAGETIVLTLP